MSAFGIVGTGFAVPEPIRDNGWWPRSFVERFEERARRDPTTPEVFLARAKTPEQRVQFEEMLKTYRDPFRGSRERRIAPDDMKCSDLEVAAAKTALEHAKVRPEDLRFVIDYSWPPDHPVPNNASLLAHRLGATSAFALEVDTACCSFLTGARVAEALLRDTGGHALVACGSLFSRTQDWDDPSAIGIGDGAGAAVIGPVEDGLGFLGHAAGTRGELYTGVCCAPKTEGRWYEGGAPLQAHSKDIEAGHAIVTNSARWAIDAVDAATAAAGIERGDISHFYAHQPASWFNATCRRAAGLDVRTMDTFDRYASMGSANIPINLVHAQREGQLRRGDTLLMYACGMGFHWAASVLRWSLD